MRKRLTYANIVATLALVFAMSGGALAASHYLINSTKQVNPKVLKKLKGAAGKTGAAGTAGPAGSAGVKGETGPAGPYPSTLAAGQSETGVWSANDTAPPAYAAISFVYPLAKPPVAHLIAPKQALPSGCSGSGADPKASPGNLCIFATFLFHAELGGMFDPASESEEPGPEAGRFGVVVFLQSTKEGHFDGSGTWAVTG
jgi:hypothetical protein